MFIRNEVHSKRRKMLILDPMNNNHHKFEDEVGITKYLVDVFEGELQLILSQATCIANRKRTKKQARHFDYKDLEEAKKNYIIFLGYMNNCKFIVYDKYHNVSKTVYYDAGDLLVARGDLLHRGGPYDEVNVRSHRYASIRDSERPNLTYLL